MDEDVSVESSVDSSVDSESDSSEELDSSSSSGEKSSSEDCVMIGKKVQVNDCSGGYYSDENEDDCAYKSEPHCSKIYGLAAVSSMDLKRIQLYPVIKLLHEKKSIVSKFLFIAKNLSDVKFREYFRLGRGTVKHLVWLMDTKRSLPFFPYKPHDIFDNTLGESQLHEFSMLLFLWYLSNLEPLQNISDQIDIPQEYSWLIICHIASWLRAELNYVVAWPVGASLRKVCSAFCQAVIGFGCLGAISGTEIPIKQPSDSAGEYLKDRGYYSIHLQVISTADHRFTNIHCGDPGSFDNLRVWKRSPLRVSAKRNSRTLSNLFPGNTFLVGKKPYELSDRILHPYELEKGFSFESAQHKYNLEHYFAHQHVEKAIERLKGRFRRLKFVDYYSLHDVPDLITTCCILHNFCLDFGNDGFFPDSPFSGLKSCGDSSIFGDNDISNKVKPKMNVGNDLRGRLVKKWQNRQKPD